MSALIWELVKHNNAFIITGLNSPSWATTATWWLNYRLSWRSFFSCWKGKPFFHGFQGYSRATSPSSTTSGWKLPSDSRRRFHGCCTLASVRPWVNSRSCSQMGALNTHLRQFLPHHPTGSYSHTWINSAWGQPPCLGIFNCAIGCMWKRFPLKSDFLNAGN
jgi:hypothetical protein